MNKELSINNMKSYGNEIYIKRIGRIIEFLNTAKNYKHIDTSTYNMVLNYYELY